MTSMKSRGRGRGRLAASFNNEINNSRIGAPVDTTDRLTHQMNALNVDDRSNDQFRDAVAPSTPPLIRTASDTSVDRSSIQSVLTNSETCDSYSSNQSFNSAYVANQLEADKRSRAKDLDERVRIPTRKGFGNQGRVVPLLTNHFEIRFKRDVVIVHHYDVRITEHVNGRYNEWSSGRVKGHHREEVRDLCFKAFNAWATINNVKNYFDFAYDRQNHVYSLVFVGKSPKLNPLVVLDNRKQLSVYLTLNVESPSIEISKASLRNLGYSECSAIDRNSGLQVLDVLHNQMMYLKRLNKKTNYSAYGRYYYDNLNTTPMNYGRQLKEGFIKSLRITTGNNKSLDGSFSLTMNIESKLSPFFVSQNLVDTVQQTLPRSAVWPPDSKGLRIAHIESLRHHLRDLRVKTKHRQHIFMITSICEKPAYKQKFPSGKGGLISVADYFAENYQTLRFPQLPCVMDQQKNFYPMEMCIVLEQKVDLKKLTADQSSQIIKKSAVHPDVRYQKIMQKAAELDSDKDQFLARAGLQRDCRMMRVDGRELAAPSLAFGNNQTVNVKAGSWQLTGCRLLLPVKVNQYVAILLTDEIGADALTAFTRDLTTHCKRMGVGIPEKWAVADIVKYEDLLKVLKQSKVDYRADLAFVFTDDNVPVSMRNAMKFYEKEVELVTQCLHVKTVKRYLQKRDQATLENIVLKINLKCGGVNNTLAHSDDPVAKKFFSNDVMFVGLDVNHPPPLSKREIAMGYEPDKPSVVGAVANVGEHQHLYIMQAKAQDCRQEEIDERVMIEIITEFLELFKINKKTYPKRIIVYRDGVSESQFNMVSSREAFAIKSACLQMGLSLKLTIFSAQKRHNTRFFRQNIDDKNKWAGAKCAQKNISPGTVVDTGPTNPTLNDFFLASQSGIQGTTKATNYSMLYDENEFGEDEMQRLTYLLCHVYQRATKSVSLPAPCYFAHHAATRGKELVDFYLDNQDESRPNLRSSGSNSDSASVHSGSSSQMRVPLNFTKINENIRYSRKFGNRTLFL